MEQVTKKINVKGFDEFLGETLIGGFVVKTYLTPLDVIKADSIFRELLGGVNPMLASDDAKNMAFVISQLNVRVVESPAWFKSKTDYDGGHIAPAILNQILNKAVQVQSDYQIEQEKKYKRLKGEFEEKLDSGRVDYKNETNASETPLNDSDEVFDEGLE